MQRSGRRQARAQAVVELQHQRLDRAILDAPQACHDGIGATGKKGRHQRCETGGAQPSVWRRAARGKHHDAAPPARQAMDVPRQQQARTACGRPRQGEKGHPRVAWVGQGVAGIVHDVRRREGRKHPILGGVGTAQHDGSSVKRSDVAHLFGGSRQPGDRTGFSRVEARITDEQHGFAAALHWWSAGPDREEQAGRGRNHEILRQPAVPCRIAQGCEGDSVEKAVGGEHQLAPRGHFAGLRRHQVAVEPFGHRRHVAGAGASARRSERLPKRLDTCGEAGQRAVKEAPVPAMQNPDEQAVVQDRKLDDGHVRRQRLHRGANGGRLGGAKRRGPGRRQRNGPTCRPRSLHVGKGEIGTMLRDLQPGSFRRRSLGRARNGCSGRSPAASRGRGARTRRPRPPGRPPREPDGPAVSGREREARARREASRQSLSADRNEVPRSARPLPAPDRPPINRLPAASWSSALRRWRTPGLAMFRTWEKASCRSAMACAECASAARILLRQSSASTVRLGERIVLATARPAVWRARAACGQPPSRPARAASTSRLWSGPEA